MPRIVRAKGRVCPFSIYGQHVESATRKGICAACDGTTGTQGDDIMRSSKGNVTSTIRWSDTVDGGYTTSAASLDMPGQVWLDKAVDGMAYMTADEAVVLATNLLIAAREARENEKVVVTSL